MQITRDTNFVNDCWNAVPFINRMNAGVFQVAGLGVLISGGAATIGLAGTGVVVTIDLIASAAVSAGLIILPATTVIAPVVDLVAAFIGGFGGAYFTLAGTNKLYEAIEEIWRARIEGTQRALTNH